MCYSIFTDMYGHKGGNKSYCVYPTVKNVRDKFYEIYPGEPPETFDPTKGDIPVCSEKKFRYEKYLIGMFNFTSVTFLTMYQK